MKRYTTSILILSLLLLTLGLSACGPQTAATRTADGAQTAQTAEATALTWVSFGGQEVQLSTLPLTCFRGLGADQTVRTSNGDTHLATGIAIAGSELRAEVLSGSAEWQLPAVCLHYSIQRGREALITELGQTLRLRVDGSDHAARVVWYTDEMLYFVFDCPTLPESEPVLALEGERLVVLYE